MVIDRSSDPRKFQFGEVTCSPHTIAQLLEELRLLLVDKSLSPRTILCINSHIYNVACSNAQLRDCLTRARVITADGMAIVWAARVLGHDIPERCNMTEAYHAFLSANNMPCSRAILIGCSQEEASTAAEKANRNSKHCRIVATYSGYLEDHEYENVFRQHPEIDFIFLGMGTPKTELVADMAARECPKAVIWGIGGGTLRIEAGTMREAPAIWRRSGLQWLHRLASEPSGLWRRYMMGNPLFVWRVLRLAARRRLRRS
jgi:N-acetylglucosaminyldiphosphoundecaprenol N-acetyl-beta-D-mannosaminyltransferase